MARRSPNDIGTHAASAVVRYLRTAGFPHAERAALRGARDVGDVTGIIGACVEVKGGTAAKTASDGQIAAWLDETMRETANAGADVGILVVARAGIGEANAGRWWAVMPGVQYEELCLPSYDPAHYFGAADPVRIHLAHACRLLTYAGYGSREVAA